MWWRDDTQRDEVEELYKHILELESRIAKLVAHQVRVRRLLMQDSSEGVTDQVVQVQKEVEYFLNRMRLERQELVDIYNRRRIERSIGRVREVNDLSTSSLSEWDEIEDRLALEVEQLRRVLMMEQKRRQEGW
ncbi:MULTISPECIES: hypothetical protein [unclassified Exiguobacterium]|uniref:hypothetical protein n=1 Tax=unclassified Exiguobacterium TaxID=2644629 RepID=UPI001BE5C6E6|nr:MULTISPECIES: hypothetical protein [unclassified Exiguobacterium]MCV9899651.1 hypothetical protein [Exiguobacterium sp. N5]